MKRLNLFLLLLLMPTFLLAQTTISGVVMAEGDLKKEIDAVIAAKKAAEEDKFKFHYIDSRMLETPAIATSNLKKEIIRILS